MEMNQSPEIAASPLLRNILSAVEHVKIGAQQGRETVVAKIQEARIGMLGLTVGSAFFLAACGGEAKPPNIIANLPPSPSVPEMQASFVLT